jgi:hypothetical protein
MPVERREQKHAFRNMSAESLATLIVTTIALARFRVRHQS